MKSSINEVGDPDYAFAIDDYNFKMETKLAYNRELQKLNARMDFLSYYKDEHPEYLDLAKIIITGKE